MAKRTDVHAPSNIQPTDYSFVLAFSWPTTQDGWPIPGINIQRLCELLREVTFPKVALDRGTNHCTVCGARFIEGEVWKHDPTGEHVILGHICAAKYGMVGDRREWAALRGAALAKAMRDEKRRHGAKAARLFLAAEGADLKAALRLKHPITRDLVRKLLEWGNLTPGQVGLARKLAREAAERAAEPVIELVEVPETPERRVIRGRILGLKTVPGFSYNSETLKMLLLVETGEGKGYKVWGTVPSQILGGDRPLKGLTIELTAKVERSRNDKLFGFLSRPTKARIIES